MKKQLKEEELKRQYEHGWEQGFKEGYKKSNSPKMERSKGKSKDIVVSERVDTLKSLYLYNKRLINAIDENFYMEKDIKEAIKQIKDEIVMNCPHRRQNLIKLRNIIGGELL